MSHHPRIDCTVVCSNIHHPLDSSLLWDAVRVLTLTLKKMQEELGITIAFTDHRKRAKKRTIGILNAKQKKIRVKRYKDLLKVTEKTVSYSKSAVRALGSYISPDPAKMVLAMAMSANFKELIPLTERVIDQTTRRVIHDEQVPAEEKVVSLFEPHGYYQEGSQRNLLWPQDLFDQWTVESHLRLFDCGREPPGRHTHC